jgi:hypothetical protein
MIADKWVYPKEVHNIVEAQALMFLRSLGINAKRVRRKPYIKTPDYAWKDLAIEVTTVHDYNPPSQDYLRKFLEENRGGYIATYGYSNNNNIKPHQDMILHRKYEWNYSVLHSIQNVSYYRQKLIDEITKKSEQAEGYLMEVIILDLRTAPFRPHSLLVELRKILDLIGQQHPSIAGIIICTRRNDNSELEDVHYFFASNKSSSASLPVFKESTIFAGIQEFDLFWRLEMIGYESGSQIVPAEVIIDVESEVKNEIVRRGLPI